MIQFGFRTKEDGEKPPPSPYVCATPKGGLLVSRAIMPQSDILIWVMFYSNRQARFTSFEWVDI